MAGKLCMFLLLSAPMDGLLVDGPRFRQLREEAGVHRREMAQLLDCSPGHVRNVETAQPSSEAQKKHQLSAPKVHRARRIFAAHLGREVTLGDFTTLIESRRQDVA